MEPSARRMTPTKVATNVFAEKDLGKIALLITARGIIYLPCYATSKYTWHFVNMMRWWHPWENESSIPANDAISRYSGQFCQYQTSLGCDESPCQNGASCQDLGFAKYRCLCPEFFSGKNCETFKDPCQDPNFCRNGGSCVIEGKRKGHQKMSAFEDGSAEQICLCAPGFSGPKCELGLHFYSTFLLLFVVWCLLH